MRSRELCWECADCKGGCGYQIKYGPWRREDRPSSKAELRTSFAYAWMSGGGDPESPDIGFCNNPWTGERAVFRFGPGP